VTQVDVLKAFVDVSAVAVKAVTSEAIVTRTVVTSREVGTLGIYITSAMICGTLIDVGAVKPVAFVSFIACAIEAWFKVRAVSVGMTSINIFGALIDISAVAECSVPTEAIKTGAVMRAVSVGTVCICIASTKIGRALVNVGTVKS